MARARRIRSSLLVLTLAVSFFYLRYVRAPAPPPPSLSGSWKRETVLLGGRERSYGYYAPASLQRGAPLLLVFHGSGQTGEALRAHSGYRFDSIADREGYAVVYADGWAGHWNDCRKAARYSARTEHVDDLGFVRAIIDHLREKLGVDPERVFATGYSNGGHLAYRLALELPDHIRAIAAISASVAVLENSECTDKAPAIPALIMNGTDDPLNPYAGGHVTLFGFFDRGVVRSSYDSAAYFAKRCGDSAAPKIDELPSRDPTLWIERARWASARCEVVLDTIHGGGHVIPQAIAPFPRILGRVATAFDGPEEIWAFFARQPRR